MTGGHVVAYFSNSSMPCGSSVYWMTQVIMTFLSVISGGRSGIGRLGPEHFGRGPTIVGIRTWEAFDHAGNRGGRKRADGRRCGGRGAWTSAGQSGRRRTQADG